jgi:hypothetical protein
MTGEFVDYIDSLVATVLASPGYAELPTDKRESIRAKLDSHFQKLLVETALNRMTDEQIDEFEHLVRDRPENAITRLEFIASTIPGVAQDIEERLEREVARLQSLANR